jgi:hypothetical protein
MSRWETREDTADARISMSRQRCLAVIATLALLLGGCATVPRVDDAALHSSPDAPVVLLESVPFVAQDAHFCGPASLAMVSGYYGVSLDQRALARQMVIPDREGTLGVELAVAARRQGFATYTGPTDLSGMLLLLKQGQPVIVLQNLGLDIWPVWHYAVVIGYDLQARSLSLRSGDNALVEQSFYTFDATWARGGRWSLLVSPADRVPFHATPRLLVEAAEGLAQAAQPDAALTHYDAGLQRWPSDPALWTARGNRHYLSKRPEAAVQDYQASLALDRRAALVWNNMSYALSAMGCQNRASVTLQCAERLAPDHPDVRSSRGELGLDFPAVHDHGDSSPRCAVSLPDCPTR